MSRAALVAVALSLAVLVSGCTGSDQGQDLDVATTVAPTGPQTATAPAEAVPRTSEPPKIPKKATQNTDAGAEAFVRYWVEVLNYSRRTGYVERLQSLSASSCLMCRGYAETFATVYGSGDSIKGGVATLSNLRTAPDRYDADWNGVADVDFAALTVSKSDKTRERFGADRGRLAADAAWEEGAWKMMVLTITDKP